MTQAIRSVVWINRTVKWVEGQEENRSSCCCAAERKVCLLQRKRGRKERKGGTAVKTCAKKKGGMERLTVRMGGALYTTSAGAPNVPS